MTTKPLTGQKTADWEASPSKTHQENQGLSASSTAPKDSPPLLVTTIAQGVLRGIAETGVHFTPAPAGRFQDHLSLSSSSPMDEQPDLPPVVIHGVFARDLSRSPSPMDDQPSPQPVDIVPGVVCRPQPKRESLLAQSFDSELPPVIVTVVPTASVSSVPSPMDEQRAPQPLFATATSHVFPPVIVTVVPAAFLDRHSPQAKKSTVYRAPSASEARMFSLLAYETAQHKFDYYEYCPNQRFSNICCPKKGAIIVAGQVMHANFVGGETVGSSQTFIASQAPARADEVRFWQFAFEGNLSCIFDLTNEEDKSKGGKHDERKNVTEYYPTEGSKTYGNLTVTLTGVENYDCEKKYTYRVVDQMKGGKEVVRYHFPHWPDRAALDFEHFKMLMMDIKKLISRGGIPFVHCKAGVGRTGVVITALILEELILTGKIKVSDENPIEKITKDLILELRKQRGDQFVQTLDQFLLVVDFAKYVYAQKAPS